MTEVAENLPADPIIAAGVLIMTRSEPRQFLLMRHPDRWDLPKGHAESGETPRQTALREMEEETGLNREAVVLAPDFEHVIEYPVQYANEQQPQQKQVHYFLAWIDQPRNISCTEHDSGRWFEWHPPHSIQKQTIDPLLDSIAQYLSS